MPKISIIVPVYNVEKYLEKCLDSILSQTFTDFEMLLIDDGSSDYSGKICDEYASRDERVIVIHQKNQGLGAARNTGIANARGEYIGFIDSDDYIEADMYEILYNNLLKEDADMSLCGMFDCFEGVPPVIKKKKYMVVNAEQIVDLIFKSKLAHLSVCCKLYKRHVFEKVKFPPNIVGEDAYVVLDIAMCCERVVLTTEQKYYYIHRENSITTTHFSERVFQVIRTYEKNLATIQKEFPNLENVGKMRLCWANFYVLDKMLISDVEKQYEEMKKIVKFLRSQYVFIMKTKEFRRSRKIAMTVLLVSLQAYKTLVIKNESKNERKYK